MEPEEIDREVEEFLETLAKDARRDIIPKMRQSVFCLTILGVGDNADPYLALQVGLALLMEKPLIILAIDNAYVPPRLVALADALITGKSVRDPLTQAAMRVALAQVIEKFDREGRIKRK
jgi:hypothetical protein